MRAIAFFVSIALVVSGCSFALVEGPHVVAGKVECTQEMTVPLVDIGAAAVLIAAPFAYEFGRNRDTDDPHPIISAGMWAAGVVTAISAVYGVTKVKRCRRSLAAPTP
jgi:hypothetical protein